MESDKESFFWDTIWGHQQRIFSFPIRVNFPRLRGHSFTAITFVAKSSYLAVRYSTRPTEFIGSSLFEHLKSRTPAISRMNKKRVLSYAEMKM